MKVKGKEVKVNQQLRFNGRKDQNVNSAVSAPYEDRTPYSCAGGEDLSQSKESRSLNLIYCCF